MRIILILYLKGLYTVKEKKTETYSWEKKKKKDPGAL